MIESKALAQVAVRIICLVSPLRLNTGASTPCQDSMKLHRPKWEHPPRRQVGTEKKEFTVYSSANIVLSRAPFNDEGSWELMSSCLWAILQVMDTYCEL